jgi:hypothetical protein
VSKTARIPGTFKTQPPTLIVDRSLRAREIRSGLLDAGALWAEVYRLGECLAIVSRDPMHSEYRWHLSISHPNRYPTWDEIKAACFSINVLHGSVLAQILAPGDGSEWVNLHDNCFHLYEIRDPVVS